MLYNCIFGDADSADGESVCESEDHLAAAVAGPGAAADAGDPQVYSADDRVLFSERAEWVDAVLIHEQLGDDRTAGVFEAEVQGADRVAELGWDVRGAAQAGANGAYREGIGGPARRKGH